MVEHADVRLSCDCIVIISVLHTIVCILVRFKIIIRRKRKVFYDSLRIEVCICIDKDSSQVTTKPVDKSVQLLTFKDEKFVWRKGLHKYHLKLKQGSYWSERYLHLIQSRMWSVSLCNIRVQMVFTVTTTAKGHNPAHTLVLLPTIKTGNYTGNQMWEKNNVEVWPVLSPDDPTDISRSQGNRSCRTCSSAPGR